MEDGTLFPHGAVAGSVAVGLEMARPSPPALADQRARTPLDKELCAALAGPVREIPLVTGATAIVVAHDRSEAPAMSSRVLTMRDGRIEP